MLSASSLYHDIMTTTTTADEQNALDTIQVNFLFSISYFTLFSISYFTLFSLE